MYLRDALGGRDGASLEMHLEAEIEKLRDALGGHNGASYISKEHFRLGGMIASGWICSIRAV